MFLVWLYQALEIAVCLEQLADADLEISGAERDGASLSAFSEFLYERISKRLC